MSRARSLGYPIFEMMFAAVLFVALMLAVLAAIKGCAQKQIESESTPHAQPIPDNITPKILPSEPLNPRNDGMQI
jgi:hypothetical protein